MAWQLGILPYIKRKKNVEIYLVTSRHSGAWILPKGQEEKELGKRQVALLEAYEEAGLLGKIKSSQYIDLIYYRKGRKVVMRIFPMKVTKILKQWPESHERKRVLVKLKKIKKKIKNKQLKKGITKLSQKIA